LFDV
jgi:hypothetical protein